MRNVTVIGMRGKTPFDALVSHFISLGGESVLLDPEMVCGKDHILSAAMHAERAFLQGHHRSKNILTETILYAACDRQISKAMKKMGPKPGNDGYVACLFDIEDPKLDDIGMIRDDSLFEITEDKVRSLGIPYDPELPLEEQVLEAVAMVDLLKQ